MQGCQESQGSQPLQGSQGVPLGVWVTEFPLSSTPEPKGGQRGAPATHGADTRLRAFMPLHSY
jgi:hypothetical protein